MKTFLLFALGLACFNGALYLAMPFSTASQSFVGIIGAMCIAFVIVVLTALLTDGV